MQSIYRFRDAEVGRFLQARTNGIGGVLLNPLVLRQNFRSGEHLVHWFNTVFGQILPPHDDPTTGAISYAESVPVSEHSGAGHCEVHALFQDAPDAEAEYCVDVIRRCLADSDGTTALLIRNRTHLPLLLGKLRLRGIEYQAVEIDRLTDLPEVIDLLALTRALCHDADRLAWLALLRGPWAGLTWSDLHTLVSGDSKRTLLEIVGDRSRLDRLSADGRERLRIFVDRLTPQLRRQFDLSLRERVERAWFELHGPEMLNDRQQLENVYRYLDVLESIETAGTLADVRQLEFSLDEERVSSPGSETCRLQIMTMHKAKGLQFDNVVMYGLGRWTTGNKRSVLSWLNIAEDDGGNDMLISPVGARAELENDSLHQFIEETEKEKQQLELDRLMYVACTRARNTLHLIGHVVPDATGLEIRPPHAGTLLNRLWPVLAPVFEQRLAKEQAAALVPPPDGSALRQPLLRRLRLDVRSQEPPALPQRSTTPGRADPTAEQPVDYYWVGTAARHAGTILHRWLQQLAEGRVELSAQDIPALRPLNSGLARGLGVRREDIDLVCTRVEEALEGVLTDEKGRWVLFGEGHAEFGIDGIWENRPESVVIDRVRVGEDGNHWIVDYKTSSHEGGSLPQFLRQESDRYRPQLNKYATLYRQLTGLTARTALYFPLLQEFCEVLPDEDPRA